MSRLILQEIADLSLKALNLHNRSTKLAASRIHFSHLASQMLEFLYSLRSMGIYCTIKYYHVYWVAKRHGVAKCSFIRDRGTSLPNHPVNTIPSW